MDQYRRLFPVTREWAYLNHCAVAPLSSPVIEAMGQFLEDQARNGVLNAPTWIETAKETRRKAAGLINVKAEEIALVQNTVAGIGIVAAGLDWREGDNVVTVNGEYPANVYPWLNLRTFGVETRVVPDRAGRVVLEDVLRAVDAKTRLIALSFVEFTNGFRNDLVAVGEFCQRRKILFLVDAVQGLGVLDLDVRQAQIDFLAAGAHKWLLGPLGIGVFYCRKELLESLRVSQVGPGSMVLRAEYLPYEFRLKGDATRFEPGAQNYAGIRGFGAILDILKEANPAKIEQHVKGLLDVVVDGLQRKGCEIISSLDPKERSAMIAFRSPKMEARDLESKLMAAKVSVSARSGGVRVAPHLYNNAADIERLLAEVP